MTTTTLAAGSDNFLVPNATIIVELVLFVIVYFIFKSFIVPPLVKAMRERDEMVKKQNEDRAEAARRLAEAKQRYEASLSEARAESTKIRDEARAEAETIRQDMRAETEREVAEIKAEGEERLAEQRQQAVQQLRGEIGGLSTSLAGRILNRPVGPDGPHKATIEEFLAGLDERQPAGGKS